MRDAKRMFIAVCCWKSVNFNLLLLLSYRTDRRKGKQFKLKLDETNMFANQTQTPMKIENMEFIRP